MNTVLVCYTVLFVMGTETEAHRICHDEVIVMQTLPTVMTHESVLRDLKVELRPCEMPDRVRAANGKCYLPDKLP